MKIENDSMIVEMLPVDNQYKIRDLSRISGDITICLKTNSPDYRDWETVYTPELGWLFSFDDIFLMGLDVSVGE